MTRFTEIAVVLALAIAGCGDDGPEGEPLVVWAGAAGGPGWDAARAARVDATGAIYVAGHFEQQAVFGRGEQGQTVLSVTGGASGENRDAFLARLEPSGRLSWAVGAGGAGHDGAHAIALSGDGSVYVAGVFSDGAIFGAGQAAETTLAADLGDTFLARYTGSGELEWARSTAGTWATALHCYRVGVVALGDGSAVVKGTFKGSATFGLGEEAETTLVAQGARDDFVARYDEAGALVWARRVGGEGGAGGVDVLSDGRLVVSGEFEHTAVFGGGEPNEIELASAGHRDVYLAVFDEGGALVWADRAGSSGLETTTAVAALPSGAFLLTGVFMNAMTFDYQEASQVDLESDGSDTSYVARYDSSGSVEWAIPIGGSGWLDACAIAPLSGEGFAVTGSYDDIALALLGEGASEEEAIESTGGLDVFAAFFDASGVFVRGAGFGSAGSGAVDDTGYAIAAAGDGKVLLAGAFEGERLIFGNGADAIELSNSGRSDAFFALLRP